MTRKLAAVLAVAAIALASCGGDVANDVVDEPTPAPTAVPAPTDRDAPPTGNGETVTDTNGMAARLVKPEGGTTDARPSTYDHVEVSDRSATVFYYAGVEPCSVLDRVEVEEGADQVVITLFIGSKAGPETACIALAEYKAVQVELDRELGDRQIVDGAA
ncbi:MAG: hypothetical protein KY469_08360 [Actinobacteria bacterium]|nr:hypothetical protein [Actinomycetota bacterium]